MRQDPLVNQRGNPVADRGVGQGLADRGDVKFSAQACPTPASTRVT
jgi:hypothetical protein